MGRSILLLCATIPALVPSEGQHTTRTDYPDLHYFVGKWRVIREELRGGRIPPPEPIVLEFKKPYIFDAPFSIDPTKSPKTINFYRFDGEVLSLGIYEFDADTLKICWGGATDRPTEFKTGMAKARRGWIIIELKRVKTDP